MDYLDTLSTFAAGLRFAELPPEVRTHTGWVLADTLAAIAAGSAEPELRALAQRQRLGSGATLIGLGVQAQPEAAALVNGTGGTFLEMDEATASRAGTRPFMCCRPRSPCASGKGPTPTPSCPPWWWATK